MPNEKELNPQHEHLTKDMQFAGDEYENMEGENHSTAAEGTLKEEDKNQNTANTFKVPSDICRAMVFSFHVLIFIACKLHVLCKVVRVAGLVLFRLA